MRPCDAEGRATTDPELRAREIAETLGDIEALRDSLRQLGEAVEGEGENKALAGQLVALSAVARRVAETLRQYGTQLLDDEAATFTAVRRAEDVAEGGPFNPV